MDPIREDLLDRVVRALPGWQVLVVQFNDTVASALGVSASDLQALFVLSRHGSCTPGTLARHVGLSTGAASRMVERLVEAGLATRAADPADRRRVLVTAAPEALDAVSRRYQPLNDDLREHLGGFDEEGLRAMLAFVHAAEASTQRHLDGAGGRAAVPAGAQPDGPRGAGRART
ncbi:MarR family winged helix-turn-helix transcriptional regulator [Kineococcus gypseus]|uniref:MarR family winged helix-turn-helix transcriptional regulator n=1 Tax=Kineococcus gypseus TaxID=1637102 RepID=UPI003D7C7EC3